MICKVYRKPERPFIDPRRSMQLRSKDQLENRQVIVKKEPGKYLAVYRSPCASGSRAHSKPSTLDVFPGTPLANRE